MIKNKLKSYMSGADLSINKLSLETGISRKALKAIADNQTSGMQFDTIEVLLNYFDIEIGDFFYEDNYETAILFTSEISFNGDLIDLKNGTKEEALFDTERKSISHFTVAISQYTNPEKTTYTQYKINFMADFLISHSNIVYGVVLSYEFKYLGFEGVSGQKYEITKNVPEGEKWYVELSTKNAFNTIHKVVSKLINSSEQSMNLFVANMASVAIIRLQNDFPEYKYNDRLFCFWEKSDEELPYILEDLDNFFATFTKDGLVIPLTKNISGHYMFQPKPEEEKTIPNYSMEIGII